MKLFLATIVFTAAMLAIASGEQRILRRVIKSTPTASTLGRIRSVTVRSLSEHGAAVEISPREAHNFGRRSSGNQPPAAVTSEQPTIKSNKPAASTTASPPPITSSTTTTTSATPNTSTTPTSAPPSSSTKSPESNKPKASERQQLAPTAIKPAEVELLASAPSWQMMTSVEAPKAMQLVASSDLTSSGSSSNFQEEATADVLRSSPVKGGAIKGQQKQTTSFFYPQQQQQQQFRAASKTSSKTSQGTKTQWYRPPTTTTTTPRPAPIIQQQEQQVEQYVEQQAEYGAAPLGQAEPFAFDFKTDDSNGNGQYRKEESDKDGVVRGSYGYTDANGIYRHVQYVADSNGFRANIKSNEPGLIGETQPASIQMDGGEAPKQRLASPAQIGAGDNNQQDWSSNSNNNADTAELAALASPEFESSHKPERLVSARLRQI